MGRSLSGAFGAGPSNTVSQGVFNLKAGISIAQNDLVQLGPDGKAFPVKVTDYAAVPNMAYGTAETNVATGLIVAQTQVVAGQTMAYYRQAVIQGPDGSIYTFTNSSTSYGMLLSKYSASGGLITQVVVDGTVNPFTGHQILQLSNGNICVLAGYNGKIYLAVYDQNLTQVKAPAALTEDVPNFYFSACTLSAGGFAIVYQQTTNANLSRLVTFDNTGAAVLAPTTIWTRTGTVGTQYHRMAQLSNGNLAIAAYSANTVSSIGLFHGIVSTAGVSVLAFTNLDASAGTNSIPELSVMSGYYAVSALGGTTQKAFVFNNTGTLQGAGFSGGSSNGTDTKQKLINDGSTFYLIWPRNSDSKEVMTKLPVTGTGYSTTIITTTTGTSNYSLGVDAFYENGMIVGVSNGTGGNAPFFWVVSLTTMALISTAITSIGTIGAGNGDTSTRIIPSGDFSFIVMSAYDTAVKTSLAVGKYANTAVMGVAQGAAAADALAPTATPAGGYSCNQLAGSPTKSFDHSAANIYGNKGAMLTYGVTLKGM